MNPSFKLYFALIGSWIFIPSGNAQTIIRTVYKIPETGISKSYTDTFGEDNDITINALKLQNINNFIVLDSNTKLMWQRRDGGEMTYPKAKLFCDTLTLGGFTDWRLPTPLESYSILHLEHNNPALDVNYFTSTGAEYWYTQLTQANDTTKVWCTNAGGGIGNHPRSETISSGGTKKFHVRAVRDTWRDTISSRFSSSSNGLLKDNLTQLEWLFLGDTFTTTWESALSYAKNYKKYYCRVPNIKELQSVTDYSLVQPCFNKLLFPSTSTSKYWSSSTLFNQPGKAWYLDSRFGITTYLDKSTAINLAMICAEKPTADANTPLSPQLRRETFLVSPNPAKNVIQINATGIQKESYTGELWQLNGKQMFNFEIPPFTKSTIQDISFLNPGMYILAIRSEKHNIIYQQLFVVSE